MEKSTYVPSDKADFSEATFSSTTATFSVATFSGEAGFNKAKFLGEASFNQATFGKAYYANFEEVGFTTADFNKAKFLGEASFYKSKFDEEAYFSKATFSGETHFGSSTFSKHSDFVGTKFFEADFGGTIFSGTVNFNGAIFSGKADFSNRFPLGNRRNIKISEPTKFVEEVGFIEVEFVEADFSGATFNKKADFYLANFKSSAKFIETEFLDKADFYSACLGKSDFRGTTFKRVSFSEAGFSKEANFRHVNFVDEAEFSGSEEIFFISWLVSYFIKLWRKFMEATVAGFVIVFSFIFFFVTQSNPALIPSFYNVFLNSSVIHSGSSNATHSFTNNTKVAVVAAKPNTNYSKFIGLEQVRNPTQWQKAFERAMGDFIPLLPSGEGACSCERSVRIKFACERKRH